MIKSSRRLRKDLIQNLKYISVNIRIIFKGGVRSEIIIVSTSTCIYSKGNGDHHETCETVS